MTPEEINEFSSNLCYIVKEILKGNRNKPGFKTGYKVSNTKLNIIVADNFCGLNLNHGMAMVALSRPSFKEALLASIPLIIKQKTKL